MSNTKYNITS
jgi:hypothetical protein